MCRCNISYLEEWLKEKELQSSNAMDTLRPLSQAAWLLQVNKSTDEDAKEITGTCTELNPVQVLHSFSHLQYFCYITTSSFTLKQYSHSNVQIVKILNSYTPIDDFEKRVTSSFVRKVQVSLIW